MSKLNLWLLPLHLPLLQLSHLSKWKLHSFSSLSQNPGVMQGRIMWVLSSKYIQNLITISHHLRHSHFVQAPITFTWIAATTSKLVCFCLCPSIFYFLQSSHSDPHLATMFPNNYLSTNKNQVFNVAYKSTQDLPSHLPTLLGSLPATLPILLPPQWHSCFLYTKCTLLPPSLHTILSCQDIVASRIHTAPSLSHFLQVAG